MMMSLRCVSKLPPLANSGSFFMILTPTPPSPPAPPKKKIIITISSCRFRLETSQGLNPGSMCQALVQQLCSEPSSPSLLQPSTFDCFLHHLRMRKAAAWGPANYLRVICFCCECLCPHHTNKLLKKGGYRQRREKEKKKKANRLIWITSTVTPSSV